jgi:hypothetical protein
MSYGNESLGSSPYGGASYLFQVVSARAINPYTVVVTFSESPDYSDPETLNPANYYIDAESPGDVIGAPLRVVVGTEENTVVLTTTRQVYVLYTVSVTSLVVSTQAEPVDALGNSATFTGVDGVTRGFIAKAIRANGINLVFVRPMVVDLILSNPLSYTVRDMQGVVVPVLSATPNVPSGATRVALTLAANLRSGVAYEVTLTPLITTESGLSIIPDTDLVVWVERRKVAKVPFSAFTKEVQAPPTNQLGVSETLSVQESLSAVLAPYRIGPTGSDSLGESLTLSEGLLIHQNGVSAQASNAVTVSETVTRLERLSFTRQPDSRSSTEASFSDTLNLRESLQVLPPEESRRLPDSISSLFGSPDGLVFFSPSLVLGGAPNSSIQVDDVKACTQAYDTYTFPQTLDPQPFYLYGGSLVPTPTLSTLNSAVLFTNFYRLNEAKHNLSDSESDLIPPASDISATMLLTEIWPPARVSLLNNPAWATFDGVAAPPYDFITADNLSAFPAPTVAPTSHYLNPSETLSMTEGPNISVGTSAIVSDTITLTEVYDLTPGETVVQVNVSETLTSSESVLTHIGINLFETLVHSEVVNLS